MNVTIRWVSEGGKSFGRFDLDSTTVEYDDEGPKKYAIANALIEMVSGRVVAPGDLFTISERP